MSPPRAIMMPGASLMELTPLAGGLRVRCPGCGQVKVLADDAAGSTDFMHGGGCPVHRQIANALRIYERTTERHG